MSLRPPAVGIVPGTSTGWSNSAWPGDPLMFLTDGVLERNVTVDIEALVAAAA